jgi:predicted tellurium resistance membrane protein TerC
MEANKPNRKNTITSLFTGSFLVSNRWEKNWPFILYLSFLALIMIYSSHKADRKVHEIARLRNQMKELNSEFIETRSTLMLQALETKVVERAEEIGLIESNEPPIKLKPNTD